MKSMQKRTTADYIVRVTDFFQTQSNFYIVSELVAAPNLRQYVRKLGAETKEEIVIALVYRVMESIEKVKREFKLKQHGNLKLENIFYDEQTGQLKLSDFMPAYRLIKQEITHEITVPQQTSIT